MFKVGDRVYHKNGIKGTVTSVTSPGKNRVRVAFDNSSVGYYTSHGYHERDSIPTITKISQFIMEL